MTISVSEARRILGNVAKDYTDAQIEAIINSFMAIADLAINDSLKRRASVNNVIGAIKETEGEQNGT